MSIHRLKSPAMLLMSAWLLIAWLLIAADACATAGEWNFQVLRDGEPIGAHHFLVTEQGRETRLLSEANFKVTVLAVPLYRYRHVSHESFQGDCLQTLAASTDRTGHIGKCGVRSANRRSS